MAAHFESGFFTNGIPAWHSSGTVIEGKVSTSEEGLVLAGADWPVVKRQHLVELPVGFAPEGEELQEAMPVPDCYGIYRETDNAYLGKVGARYVPLQNVDAFKWFDPFLHEGDVYLETAGSLKGGQVVWILARLNNSTQEVVKGDPVEQRLLLTNTHNGDGSVTGAFVNTRVVCANTLAIAENEAMRSGNFVKIRHTKNMHLKLADVQSKVNLARRNFSDSVDIYRELAAREMTMAQFRASLNKLFEVELAQKDVKGEVKTLDKLEPTQKILRNFEATPDLQMLGVRGTRWAAYNAVTEFYTHQSQARSQDNRLDSLWYGKSKERIAEAQRVLLSV